LTDVDCMVDDAPRGAVLRVHVQPGASREGVAGVHGAALKVRVRAPAVSGRANEATIALLAREIGVPPGSLSLTAGSTSRDKRIRFAGLAASELRARLHKALSAAG
jgi:uncharacterized protein (TIGR00251 family)